MLILIALPIQWLFHSIAFVCFSSTAYSVFYVSEAFTTGQSFAYPGVAFLGRSAFNQTIGLRSQFDDILPSFQSASSKWDILETSQCSRTYFLDSEGLQSHRNLIIVIETGPDPDAKGWTVAQVWNDSKPPAYGDVPISQYDTELVNSLWSFAIYCEANRVDSHLNFGLTECLPSNGSHFVENLKYCEECFEEAKEESLLPLGFDQTADFAFNPWFFELRTGHMRAAFQNMTVKYCLSEPYSAPCKVYISNFFILVTVSSILLGCICSILITVFCWHNETCQSLGDALQIFLKDGEKFVQVTCASFPCPHAERPTPSLRRWTPTRKWNNVSKRWGQGVSRMVWFWTYTPIGMSLLGGSAALGVLGDYFSQVPTPHPRRQSKLRPKFADTITPLERASVTESHWSMTTYSVKKHLPQTVSQSTWPYTV